MTRLIRFTVFGSLLILIATEAHAYVGPGAGLSAIGALIGLLAAIGFAIVGFVWYPIKRIRRRLRQSAGQN